MLIEYFQLFEVLKLYLSSNCRPKIFVVKFQPAHMTKKCLQIAIKAPPKAAKFILCKLQNMRNSENVVHFLK